MTTEEMLLQLIEGQKQMTIEFNKRFDKIENDISDIKEDIADIKHEAQITRFTANHNGEVLEKLVKQLEPLNMVDVEY